MNKGFTRIALGVAIAVQAFGSEPNVAKGFRFSMPYVPGGHSTAWDIPGNRGVLKERYGRYTCTFLGDLVVPAFDARNPYTGETEWRCPDVTVRHLHTVDIGREGGRCTGMTCYYDRVQPGNQSALVAGPVNYCPDILVTTAGFGHMDVIGWKWFKKGDNPAYYIERGYPLEMDLEITEKKIETCGTKEYQGQLAYYLGKDFMRPGVTERTVVLKDRWDGE